MSEADQMYSYGQVLECISRLISEILGLKPEEFSEGDHLSDLGFDSISLGLLAQHITAQIGVKLEPVVFLEHQTAAELATHVARRHGQGDGAIRPTPIVAAQNLINQLGAIVARITGIAEKELVPSESLSQYGFDSMKLAEFAEAIARHFAVRLEPAAFLEHSSIAALAGHLESRLSRQLADETELGPTNRGPAARETGHLSGSLDASVGGPAASPVTRDRVLNGNAATKATNRTAANSLASGSEDSIAVIGISARIPGCDSLAEFWRLLMTQSSVIRRVPSSRWRWEDFDGEPRANSTDCHFGTFIEGIESFDAKHFGMTEEEARYLDPQSRLLLEACHEAVETAGYGMDFLKGKRVAVFVGAQRQEFLGRLIEQRHGFTSEVERGNLQGLMVNRLGHYFDWRGQTCVVNSACASSSMAIHLAMHALLAREADYAVAGGVNFVMSPMASIAGRCEGSSTASNEVRAFDVEADGVLIGDGCGVLLLKPLYRALADGDHVYGTVLATAAANSGRSLYAMAPNPEGQAGVVREALRRAGLGAEHVDYVEGQGAATSISDQAELKAYHSAFFSAPNLPRITNIKANIGHLETASGVVSVIKTLLSMSTGWVPGVRNLRQVNWGDSGPSPIEVVGRNEPWQQRDLQRRVAGVHNFGAGGSNVHLILASGPAAPPISAEAQRLCAFSAPTHEQLRAYLTRLQRFIHDREFELHGIRELDVNDVSYTLARRRKHLAVRYAVVVSSVAELVSVISAELAKPAGPVPGTLGSLPGVDAPKIRESCRVWLKGGVLEWDVQGRPIPLPGTVFNRVRLWPFDDEDAESNAVAYASRRSDAGAGRDRNGRSRHILDVVTALASGALGSGPADLQPDEPLGYLGFDSVSLKLFGSRLSEHFGIVVRPIIFFEHSTLRAVASYLAGHGSTVERPASLSAVSVHPEDEHDKRAIAVVGIAARLPGAGSKEEFWQNQIDKRNCISEIPSDRWDWKAVAQNSRGASGKATVRWGGFIREIDQFAPGEFNISQYEAELMDPQHRLFLKTAWEAIWDAGYDPQQLTGSAVGVFVGVQFQDYQQLLSEAGLLNGHACTGNAHTMLPNRLSYLLDLRGPSEAIDTACSSSLVALHHAVQAIRAGDCESAIVGGSNLLLCSDSFVMGGDLGVLSPTGQCRTMDARADGYVRSEGVIAILLKPLTRAVAERDHIYGVIRSTAVNHGGKATSLTAPNVKAQSELMIKAISDAAIPVDSISYVEMHGTGTELGDPIEVEAVKSAFRALRQKQGISATSCALGSVKANIGHLEAAAGLSGLVNVLMALSNRALPGLSNFERKNPLLDLDNEEFTIQVDTATWSPKSGKRCALVNSFGFGGANASVVVSEAPDVKSRNGGAAGESIVPLAASSPSALRAYAGDLLRAVQAMESLGASDTILRDVAFTMQQRRGRLKERAVIKARSFDELKGGLAALSTERALPSHVASSGHRVGSWPRLATQWLATGEAGFEDDGVGRRCPLPISPWQDRRCWFAGGLHKARAGKAVFVDRTEAELNSSHQAASEVENADVLAVSRLTDDEVTYLATQWLKDGSDGTSVTQAAKEKMPAGTAAELDLEDHTSTVRRLSRAIGRLLKASSVDGSSDLRQLGVDSIMAPRLAEELGQVFEMEMPPTLLIQTATVAELAVQIGAMSKRPQAA